MLYGTDFYSLLVSFMAHHLKMICKAVTINEANYV